MRGPGTAARDRLETGEVPDARDADDDLPTAGQISAHDAGAQARTYQGEEDVDLFSPDAMLWALATRVLWSRDVITVEGLSGSSLDPVLPEGVSTTAKVGIDATRTPGYPVVATVPDAPR